MRKKKNLIPRLNAVEERLAKDKEDLQTRIGGKPLWVELGCGMGRFAALTAKANPDICVAGFERVREAIVVAAERAETPNLTLVCCDVQELEQWIEPSQIQRLFIQFCDPWHKKRHSKRRLTHRLFLEKYALLLSSEGELTVKTDNVPLFDFTLEELAGAGWNIMSYSRDWHNEPDFGEDGQMTEYELKFHALGHPICRITAVPPRK